MAGRKDQFSAWVDHVLSWAVVSLQEMDSIVIETLLS